MWKFKAIVVVFLSVLMLGGSVLVYAVPSESEKKLRSVSGEIAYVNVKLGKLQLEGEPTKNLRYPTEFRINQEATNVTDPTDKKFLTIKDLRAGQHVAVEFNWVQGEWEEPAIALKITAYPMPEPVLQEATGEFEAIDLQVGTIIISQKSLSGEEGKRNFLYFVFEPKDIVVMKAPNMDPVQLDLRPGDIVKIEFVVSEGQRHARSITLLQAAPETTSTTTTTTTTTSTRKIIVEPTPAPAMQEATGELEAIDIQAGTLMIEQKSLPNETGENNLFFFVFDPKDIVIMRAPSIEPVQLALNPGDIVNVKFMVSDGKRHAQSITLLTPAPETASTTKTTTTVSTTVTQ
jgi:hypothetical protein